MLLTRLFYSLLLLTFLMLPLAARAEVPDPAEHTAREELARDMANMTLSILKDQKKPVADRQMVLQQGFSNVVDIDWIAKFVLGNAWRSANDEQRERYTALYRKYLMQMYVATYAENPDRKITDIKVIDVNDHDKNKFSTRTEIRLSTAEKIRVDYLASGSKEQGYKIIDVVIEGVSLLAAHRSEFTQLAAAKGVDGVISRLEHLTTRGVSYSMN